MKNKFAQNLKRLREGLKLTQSELANKINLTQRKISYLESNQIEPDLDTLIRIAAFFDVSYEELLGIDA